MDSVRKRTNYFVAGPPVSGEDFFGREQLLKNILSLLHTGQSLIVIGGARRMGKSSVLLHLQRDILSVGEPFLNVWISEAEIYDGHRFAHSLADRITEQLQQLPQPSQTGIRKAIESLESLLLKEASKEDRERLWLSPISKTFEILREHNIQIILLIDEIDGVLLNLREEERAQVAGFIRDSISYRIPCMICTSFSDPVSVKISQGTSVWYNVFHIEHLGLFTNDEALNMLTVLSEKSGNKFTENECLLLMEIFGNFPFYLQSVGWQLFAEGEFQSVSGNARKQAIANTIPRVAYDMEHYHLSWLLNNSSEEELALMLKMAQGKSISKKEEKLFQRLRNEGLAVGTPEKPKVFSLLLEEAIRSLPEESVLAKASKSEVWQTARRFAFEALRTATSKAIEAAISKYL